MFHDQQTEPYAILLYFQSAKQPGAEARLRGVACFSTNERERIHREPALPTDHAPGPGRHRAGRHVPQHQRRSGHRHRRCRLGSRHPLLRHRAALRRRPVRAPLRPGPAPPSTPRVHAVDQGRTPAGAAPAGRDRSALRRRPALQARDRLHRGRRAPLGRGQPAAPGARLHRHRLRARPLARHVRQRVRALLTGSRPARAAPSKAWSSCGKKGSSRAGAWA